MTYSRKNLWPGYFSLLQRRVPSRSCPPFDNSLSPLLRPFQFLFLTVQTLFSWPIFGGLNLSLQYL